MHDMYLKNEPLIYNVSDGRAHQMFKGGPEMSEADRELLNRKLHPEVDHRLHRKTRDRDEFGRLITREVEREMEKEIPKSGISRIKALLSKEKRQKIKGVETTGHEALKPKKTKKFKFGQSKKPLSLNPFQDVKDRMKVQDRMKEMIRKAKRTDTYRGSQGRWERRDVITGVDFKEEEKKHREGLTADGFRKQQIRESDRKRKIEEIDSGLFIQMPYEKKHKPNPRPPMASTTSTTVDDDHFNAIFSTASQLPQSVGAQNVTTREPKKDKKKEPNLSLLNPSFAKKKKGSWRDRLKKNKP